MERNATTDQPCCLRGLVTEQDLELAEREFPGICELHRRRGAMDRTFLELLHAYLCEPRALAA
ncbi:MAG TPA: hypothetical protein VHE35_32915 [Kofleriaceae bacterium]|nr:hypothetical protein [Kofleriaceae bacterium]